MSAVHVQKLQCQSCSGPLAWDGAAPVVKCPQCATPHATRWSPDGSIRSEVAPPPPTTPLPAEKLRRLEAAWKRTDAHFFEREEDMSQGLIWVPATLGFAAFAWAWLLDRWSAGNLFALAGVVATGTALAWGLRNPAFRRRTEKWHRARAVYEQERDRLTV